jgi:hypothetical protein
LNNQISGKPADSSSSSSSSSGSASNSSSSQAKLKDAPPPEPSGPPLLTWVVPLGTVSEKQAALLDYIAEGAVKRAKVQSLITPADALDPTAAQARADADRDAAKELKAAHGAYDQLDFDVAGELSDRAYGHFLKGNLVDHFPQLVEAWELKIATFASDPNKMDRVRAELQALLPVDLRSELSPNLFNPDVIAAAEAIRTKVKQDSKLTLSVKTGTVPAWVFVDGTFRGVAPLDVPNLAPASHFVTLIAPGFHLVQKRVNPGSDPKLDVALEPAELGASMKSQTEALRAAFHGAKLAQAMADLGKTYNADQVLLVGVEPPPPPQKQGVLATVVRTQVQGAQIVDDVDAALPDDDAKLASTADDLVTRATTQDKLLTSKRAPREELASKGGGGGGGALRYVGYGLIGLGAVAAVGGVYFGLQEQTQEKNFSSTAQTSSVAGSIKNTGTQDAYIADAAYGAAVIAVGVGVVLAIVGGSSSAQAEDKTEVVEAPKPAPKSSSSSSTTAAKSDSKSDSKPKADTKSTQASSAKTDSKPTSTSSSSSTSSSTAAKTDSKPATKADTKPTASTASSTSNTSSTSSTAAKTDAKPVDAQANQSASKTDTKPADTSKPVADSKPATTKADTKPADTKPATTSSSSSSSTSSTSTSTASSSTTSNTTKPTETKPAETKPATDSQPTQTKDNSKPPKDLGDDIRD